MNFCGFQLLPLLPRLRLGLGLRCHLFSTTATAGTNVTAIANCTSALNQSSLKRWTNKEEVLLTEAVQLYGVERGAWKAISRHVSTRTQIQCYHKWFRSMNPTIRHGEWSDEESRLLREAVQTYGEGRWSKISAMFEWKRTAGQCLQRYRQITIGRTTSNNNNINNSSNSSSGSDRQSNIRQGRWSEVEDQLLIKATEKLTPYKLTATEFWKAVSQEVGSRTALQCRLRWQGRWATDKHREPWSISENLKLIDLVRKYGNQWKLFEQNLPGRSSRQIAARWHNDRFRDTWLGPDANKKEF